MNYGTRRLRWDRVIHRISAEFASLSGLRMIRVFDPEHLARPFALPVSDLEPNRESGTCHLPPNNGNPQSYLGTALVQAIAARY